MSGMWSDLQRRNLCTTRELTKRINPLGSRSVERPSVRVGSLSTTREPTQERNLIQLRNVKIGFVVVSFFVVVSLVLWFCETDICNILTISAMFFWNVFDVPCFQFFVK